MREKKGKNRKIKKKSEVTIKKVAIYLYTHNGLPKDHVYYALRSSMEDYPPRRVVREWLKGKKRFSKKIKGKLLYTDKKREFRKIMSPELYEKQMNELRKNYVKNAIMKTEVSARRFNPEIQNAIIKIYKTDDS